MTGPAARAGRAAIVRALLRPTGRIVAWTPFGVGAGVGVAVVAAASRMFDEVLAADAAALLRVAAVCGAVGAAFLLDDPAARSTRAVPVGRALRLGVRLAVVAPALVLWWGAALAVVGTVVRPGERVPWAGLTVEAAALVCGALAVAAGTVRGRDSGRAGAVAASAVVFGVVAVFRLPSGLALMVPPGDSRWAEAHRWWAVLLGLGAVALCWAAREPVRGRAATAVRALTR